ncbi:MAG: DUF4349 domain-containing protein [Pyrinomonadaceae bacterium]
MRLTILIVCYSCIFFTACSPGADRTTNSISTASDSSEKTKISFGIYDISKGGPSFSDLFAPPAPLLQKGISPSEPAPSKDKNQQSGDVVNNATVRSTNVNDAEQTVDRRVIKNAEMHLESKDPDLTQKVIVAVAEANTGFVLSTEQSMSDITQDVRDSVSITIRIPADRFAASIDAIRQSADRFLVESIKGEDVTEEFVDIQARLRAKKALEEQFMQIMKQSETVEDALLVQSRLADVRTEIEKIEGRLRFLQTQTSFSTIKVFIQTPTSLAAQSAGFFGKLGDSAARGADAAGNFTLGLVTLAIGALPLILFLGLPIFLIGRSFWPRNRTTMSVTEIAEDEIKTE